jgi:predicted ester cyclase
VLSPNLVPRKDQIMNKQLRVGCVVGVVSGAALFGATTPARATAPPIGELVVCGSVSAAEREATLTAVRAFYGFWDSGDASLLARALAPNFTDRTLPPGRPQGPEGPAFASRQFRAAVPDLRVTVEKMVMAGGYVTVHMTFHGHFSGRMGQTAGGGQPISFIATDLLRVKQGRITDNWHIEDNLTLLRQMGLVPKA